MVEFTRRKTVSTVICVSVLACSGALTVMVVKNVRVDISQNTLSTGGIDITVGTVDEFAASVDQVLAVLVLKGSLGAEGTSNTNAVSVESISRLAQDTVKSQEDETYSSPAAGSESGFKSQQIPWLNQR